MAMKRGYKDLVAEAEREIVTLSAEEAVGLSGSDDVVFVEEIPHTATGKIKKITLREQFAGYRLPTA